jgi:hypothetical protein
MAESVSERIVDQRLRNRIMEEVCSLSEGVDYIETVGAVEYFNAFFFQVDPLDKQHNSALNEQERAAICELWELMNQASDAVPKNVSYSYLIQTGWPEKITLVAERVLIMLLKRGRFSEDSEEAEPSFEAGQAWYNAVEEKAS